MIRDIAIILAAGESRRMDQVKALLPAGRGHTFVSQLAERCRKAGLVPLVVTGAHAREIKAAHPTLWQVVNRQWRKGQLSSVLTGLRASALARRVVIQPVDAPDVSVATLKKLRKAKAPAAAAAYRGELGHPVSVDGETARALLKTRAKTLEAALALLEVAAVPVTDRAVLENLNDPKALKARRK
ncbi:MAG: NTP transferase domain-containing protein [Archangiaceae bacterium]|nr:NTP transferase domain-containing protein [Archangiaceae bacterium]